MASPHLASLHKTACHAPVPLHRRSSNSCRCRISPSQPGPPCRTGGAAPPLHSPQRRSTLIARAAAEDGESEEESEEDYEEEAEEFEEEEEFEEDDEEAYLTATGEDSTPKIQTAPTLPKLSMAQQYGLEPWEPGISMPTQQAAGAAEGQAAGSVEAPPSYEELLQRLPGLSLQLRIASQERVGLAPKKREPDQNEYMDDRYPRKPEPELGVWDLRAKMEKRQRQEGEMQEWNERRARVGQYPSLGADWRSDVRCQHTGNPLEPNYREWTHKEVWDLITLGGINADPRDVALFVRNPQEIADAPAQGAEYRMGPEEYFESLGRLIHEDDLAAIAAADKDAEALLASEFSDFDDELVATRDFDSDYAAAEEKSSDDDF